MACLSLLICADWATISHVGKTLGVLPNSHARQVKNASVEEALIRFNILETEIVIMYKDTRGWSFGR